MKKFSLSLFLSVLCVFIAQAAEFSFNLPNHQLLTVTWYSPSIVRVVKLPSDATYDYGSLSVTATPEQVKVNRKDYPSSGRTVLSSSALVLKIDTTTGQITYETKKGDILTSECSSASFTEFDDNGHAAFTISQSFSLSPDEAIFGLGIIQNGQISQRNQSLEIAPGNIQDGIPFFQSIKGYGIYWDNYSTTQFTDANNVATFSSVVADAVEYFFMYGGNADGVISCIRQLTGSVPMSPLWSYGFMQSKERYKSQDETLGVLMAYRKAGIPIDCIIQDWQYWGSNYLWNAMDFLSENFDNAQAMIDSIHANNAHLMISIWQSFGPHTLQYRQLDSKGLLMDIDTWPQSGISHVWPPRMEYPSGVRVYNPYSPEARDIYWSNLRRLYSMGVDGWWMDSTEPDHFNIKESDFDYQTGIGTYRSLRLAFPLMCVGGVYDHQRAESDSTRAIILTRSGAFGQQRYGSNVWSGDVPSSWDMLRKQIPAGLNFSLTGNPNFNTDLGGFFAGSYNGAWNGKPAYENPFFQELYARWMQQGIFTPMMRSHGTEVPRELYYYGSPGTPVYDALLAAIKLRYRLAPYIYSTAHDVSAHDGTFMRALVMDFSNDSAAVAQTGEYMFGKSLLATPVLHPQYTSEATHSGAETHDGWTKFTSDSTNSSAAFDFSVPAPHQVYLPEGTDWYYFNNGQRYQGGQRLTLDISLSEVPFFVKAGTILPLGPDVQYMAEKPWDRLQILVFPGDNAEFVLYEDQGDGYAYENGEFTEIPMKWNDKSRTLSIGKRIGQYPGMITSRTFEISLPDGSKRTVSYDGSATKVKF